MALTGILPPIALALPIVLVAWRPLGRARSKPGGALERLGGPLAIGLGYLAGHVALIGWPPLALDVELKHGLFYLALAATLGGVFEAGRGRASLGLRAVLALATPWYLLDFVREYRWGTGEGVLWTLGIGTGLWLLLGATEVLAGRRSGALSPSAWLLTGCLGAGALHASGSSSLAQLTGAWTSVAGVLVVAAALRPRVSLSGGAGLPLVLLLAGGVLGGHYTGELAATSTLLLLLAPLGPWLAGASRPAGAPSSRRFALGLLVSVSLAGAALWIEIAGRPVDPYGGYY